MFIATPGVRTTKISPARSATGNGVRPMQLEVELAEVLAVGDADEVTRRVVGPVVVRAGEPPAVPMPFGHDDRAPVAALVDEGPHLAVAAAGQQHRDVHHRHRLVGRRAAQLTTEGEHQRAAA